MRIRNDGLALALMIGFATLGFSVTACDDKPDTLGEAIDDAGEKIEDKLDDAGEKIDDAVDDAKDDDQQ